jgi:hypothetical protein
MAEIFVKDIRDSIFALKEIDRAVRRIGTQREIDAWVRLMEAYTQDILEDLDIITGEGEQLPLPLKEG